MLAINLAINIYFQSNRLLILLDIAEKEVHVWFLLKKLCVQIEINLDRQGPSLLSNICLLFDPIVSRFKLPLKVQPKCEIDVWICRKLIVDSSLVLPAAPSRCFPLATSILESWCVKISMLSPSAPGCPPGWPCGWILIRAYSWTNFLGQASATCTYM